MTLHVNDGGTVKEAKELHVNDGGVVKEVKEGWVNDGGVVKQFYTSVIPPYLLFAEQDDLTNTVGYLRNDFGTYTPSTFEGYEIDFHWDDAEGARFHEFKLVASGLSSTLLTKITITGFTQGGLQTREYLGANAQFLDGNKWRWVLGDFDRMMPNQEHDITLE
jgi:hypothetical protein